MFEIMKLSSTNIENRFRPFQVSFSGPTNSRGARIWIKDLRRNKKKLIEYSYDYNNSTDEALNYLESIGIKITGMAMLNNDALLLTEDFQTDLR